MTSKVKKMLLEEAAALENDFNFKKLRSENPVTDLLLIFGFENGHIHGVLPEKHVAENMLKTILENECGVDLGVSGKNTQVEKRLPKKIVFHNRQAIGDILMFTCAVRDFKNAFPDIEVQVQSTAMHIWDYNPNINKDKWHEIIDPMRYWNSKSGKPNSDQMLSLSKRAIEDSIDKDKPVLLYIGPGKLTNASNRKDLHFANAYRISMETVLGVQIPQGPIRPDIYMSESELLVPPIIEPPYWLITAGEKGDWTCKTFPFAKWQEVIDKLPQIKFVQLGGSNHKHPELKGDNVVNFIGKTQDPKAGIRMLFNLFNNCEGSMGLVSFQMHLAAAFNKPCVVIAGAREPVHFTRYPGQQYLASDGCLPCTLVKNTHAPTACWFCKIERCPYHTKYGGQEVPLCSDLFSSDDVVKAILRYYEGGRLSFDKPVGLSKLVNTAKDVKVTKKALSPVGSDKPTKLESDSVSELLKTPEGREILANLLKVSKVVPNDEIETTQKEKQKIPVDITLEVDPSEKYPPLNRDNLWGFEFGGGSITDRDWEFIKGIIEENKVGTILEFGAGLSTLLFNDLENVGVITYETNPSWIKKIKTINPNCLIYEWDGKVVPEDKVSWFTGEDGFKYDFVFVDGPPGGASREFSTKYASELSDLVIVHDAGREYEKMWQEKYLEPDFYLATRGGHRCHFWRRGRLTPIGFNEGKPLAKVVFNGRGDGGAERSICWIMKQLVETENLAVQYISPNPQPCGTFRREPIPGVEFINDLSLIKDECELLLLYTNDWVWDFPKLSDIFSNLKTNRKVMGVNYKAGKIADLDWCNGWDQYLFLNSTLQKQTNKHNIPNSHVFAPPTDLSIYFNNQPDYDTNLKIVRHSSQGDVKYPKTFNEMVDRILTEIPDSEIFLMPAPSFLLSHPLWENRLHVHQRNVPPVNEFLSQGNVFWYALPGGGYSEGGPKVIMEAQASGLPVIADNHSGAIDRLSLTEEGLLGFLCNNFDEHLKALKELSTNIKLRKLMGTNCKSHAKKNYDPYLWIEGIVRGFPETEADKQMRGILKNMFCNTVQQGV